MKLKLKNLKYSFRCLKEVIKKHPAFLICGIIEIICLVITKLIPINVVGKIVSSFKEGQTFKEILYIIITNVIVFVIASIVYEIIDFVKYYINSHFKLAFSITLFEKLKSVDYEFHQSPNFLDNYTRALDNGAEKIYNVALKQMDMIKEIVQSIFILSIVFSTSKLAVLYALIVTIIYLFMRRRSSELQFISTTKQRPFMRIDWGISLVYFVKDAIPDLKTTNINDVLLEEHEMVNKERLKIYKKIVTKKTICDTISQVLMASIFPVMIFFISLSTIKNKDIAALASLTVAATTISQCINRFITIVTQIQMDALEAKVTFEVLDMDSKIEGSNGDEVREEFQKLEIKNMSFGYTEKMILNDINLEIKKGEKVAIVGTNGAGKTTLVKLLLRLYDPQNGVICYNDKDYKSLNPKSLRRKIGAVFQNPEVYSVSVGENVLLKEIETEEEREKVVEALKFADIYDYIMTLPEGIDTMVTREFRSDGAVFSGGQLQKIAVARGYCQNYEVLLLDEPSSRLDPIAEAKMYRNMLKMGEGKTLIFISHRLSAAVNCDKILLFENGIIKEKGTHEELMKIENGKYKEMFVSQAEKYIGDNND